MLVSGTANSSGTLNSPRTCLRYFLVFQIKILSIAAFLRGQSLKFRAIGFIEFDTFLIISFKFTFDIITLNHE